MLNTLRCKRGIVSAPHHLAAQSGRDILAAGGTAVEAAVAVAATLAVVYPHMTGIGGDGFWLIREPRGPVRAIQACGRSAASATLSLYEGRSFIPARGPLAANTVAGTVSGWAAALDSPGCRLPLHDLLSAATHFAKEGFVVTRGGAEIAQAKGPELRRQPGAYRTIFEPESRPLGEGDLLRQPQLAQTLQALAHAGLQDFYAGDVARSIALDLAALGSPVAALDLAAHHATQTLPLTASIRGAQLFNLPPPTQGVASLLILSLFDRLPRATCDSFAHIHNLVEATKQAFLIRDAHVGDPRWSAFDPQALLNDAAAIDALSSRIDPDKALPWGHPAAAGDTVWFGAADARGQVVSAIQSTYFEFGSGLVLPATGIVWQNRGTSFRLTGNLANTLAPARYPFTTLNPALALLEDGRTMAYGTMGGEGQPQTQAAVFTRYVSFGVPLQAAISAPRWLLGRTWGEETTSLKLEDRFPPELLRTLQAVGHEVEIIPAFSSMMGHAGAVVRHADGMLEGATDPRSDGAVAAW
jgi:gamma-glutamyltranspeptidase